MKSVVFLTQENPFPPRGGGALRDCSLIRALAQANGQPGGVEVLYFSSDTSRSADSFLPADLQGLVKCFPIVRERRPYPQRMISPFRPYVANGFSSNVAEALKNAAGPGRVLWLSRLAMGKYLSLGRELGYQTVLDEHNVESELWLRSVKQSPLKWNELPLALLCRLYERTYCGRADAVIATSEKDARTIRELTPRARVHVLPNTLDVRDFSRVKEVGDSPVFLFMGTLSYQPNEEGLNWFMDHVLPSFSSGPLCFLVAGANPSLRLAARLQQAGIELIANPPSMAPLLERAQAILVPLLSGSGTRLKIIEALAAGRPVISTSKGAEGLELDVGSEILIADTPRDFADAIQRVATDGELRKSLAQRGRARAQQSYDWRTLVPQIIHITQSLDEKGRDPSQ